MNPPRLTLAPGVSVGGGGPLLFIAGPCTLESAEMAMETARSLAATADALGAPLVFKGSFDKANRSRPDLRRGPGIVEGLAILDRVRRETGLPVLTDVHECAQIRDVSAVCDVLQVPAFLCRQTDLLRACGASGRAVNVKKGQFMSAEGMAGAVAKVREAGGTRVLLTERGNSFGYADLVVDLRNLPRLAALGCPVVFDATHAVQRPGAENGASGGDRDAIPYLLRAAIAAGVDAVFLEVHPDPSRASSDAATQVPLARAADLMTDAFHLHAHLRSIGPPPGVSV